MHKDVNVSPNSKSYILIQKNTFMKHKYFYNYSLSAAVFLRQRALCLTLCNWFSGLRLELLEGHNSELLGLQFSYPLQAKPLTATSAETHPFIHSQSV